MLDGEVTAMQVNRWQRQCAKRHLVDVTTPRGPTSAGTRRIMSSRSSQQGSAIARRYRGSASNFEMSSAGRNVLFAEKGLQALLSLSTTYSLLAYLLGMDYYIHKKYRWLVAMHAGRSVEEEDCRPVHIQVRK